MRIVGLQLYVCGAVLLSQSYGQEPDRAALEAQLREEAPLAWKRLESKHRQTRFEWKETEVNNSRDEQQVRSTNGSNCYRGDDFVIHLGREGRTKVWGGNGRYLFTVTKQPGEDSWALSQFGPRADDPVRNGDWEYGVQTRIPWCIFDVPCPDLTSDPTFKIQSLKKSADGSVDLRFSLNPQSKGDGNPQIASARVVLLPDQDWAISTYEANLTRPGRPDEPPVLVSASVDYGPEEDSFLNIKHTKYELRWEFGGKQRWTTWERDVSCQRCNEPVESFTLASFGLSEPALLSESNAKTRPWLWLNVAAVLCLLAAFILRSRLKAREE